MHDDVSLGYMYGRKCIIYSHGISSVLEVIMTVKFSAPEVAEKFWDRSPMELAPSTPRLSWRSVYQRPVAIRLPCHDMSKKTLVHYSSWFVGEEVGRRFVYG